MQVMAIAAVMVTDLFVGLETYVWTAWVFFAVFAGIIIVVVYTVSAT
jgi:phospholipid-translocating ATPase